LDAELFLHGIEVFRAEAGVADALDPAADAQLAAGAGDEAFDASDGEWKQGRHAKRGKADTHATAGSAVHQIREQESCGGPEKGRRGKCAGFNPLRGCVIMLVGHAKQLNPAAIPDNSGKSKSPGLRLPDGGVIF
jgi:hypothetical protein